MKAISFFLLFALSSEARDIKKERASDWVKAGFWSYQKGDFREAISCYRKALELKPDFADAWYWYGNSLFRYGMMDLCKESWERYLKLSDDPYVKHKLERYWGEKKTKYTNIFTVKGDILDEARFFSPAGIYVDRLDNLYVAGFGNDCLLKLSPFGRLLLKISTQSLKKPYGVCTDKSGNIYATSYANNCVLKFSTQGKFLLKFGKKGRKNGEFIGPKGISVDSSGYIYVVDAQRMQKFSPKGIFISKIDDLLSPNNLAFDNEGFIFIVDNLGVKKFDSSLNALDSFSLQSGISPKWISIYNNNLYITTKNGVFVYSKEKKCIDKIKTDFVPKSLSINRFGLIYISSPDSSDIYTFSSPNNNLDLLVNRIDLANYPMVLFSVTLKKDKYDVSGMGDNNFRILEENRATYPLGVDEVLKRQENLGISFVIEDSKNIKEKDAKKLLYSLVNSFKDGFQGAGIIPFSNTSWIFCDFTLNKTKIRNCLEGLRFKDSTSANAFLSSLNKGIDAAVSLLSKKAIVVITSVKLEEETNEIKRLKNYAKNNGIPIFIIDYKKDKDPILEKIAFETDGKYLLSRNSKEVYDFNNFLALCLANQTQYILYYHSPNSSLKWSNEWVSATIEAGCGKFGYKERVSYLIPDFGGANSSLGRALIEQKLYFEQAKKIEEREIKLKEKRKKIEEILKAGKAKHGEGGEGAKEEEKEGEEEEEGEKKGEH